MRAVQSCSAEGLELKLDVWRRGALSSLNVRLVCAVSGGQQVEGSGVPVWSECRSLKEHKAGHQSQICGPALPLTSPCDSG